MRPAGILLVTVSCGVAGCGFDGEAPFAGRRATDVAPWHDLGPITFCEGPRRIGAPVASGTGAAGMCGDPARAPLPCTSDGECQSRERCTCGGCQVALCDSGDECRAGDVCSFADRRCDRPCAGDGECPAGEVCKKGLGVCRAAGCRSDGDCQAGEVCATGQCVTEPCAADNDCLDQPACRLQRVAGAIHEPSPLSDGGQVVMWVERRVSDAGPIDAATAIWRAVSADGIRFRFAPERPVVQHAMGAGAPSVMRTDGGGFLLVFSDATRLWRATSSDGVAFTVDGSPLLAPTGWDAAGQVSPSLAPSPSGGLALYYAAADRSGIGLAESADGVTFVARPENPVLTPASVSEPILWRDVSEIAAPFAEPALAPDGTPFLRVFFAARGRESGSAVAFGDTVVETPNWSIGEASTLDGRALVPWPFDPVFDRVHNFLKHVAESDPAVLPVGEPGRRLLYYRGADADGKKGENLGAAENPIPAG